MFSTINCLFDGFAGKLYGESSRLVWLLLVTFLAGWAATFFAGWVSFPSYYAMLEHLPGARIAAMCFTAGIAGFIYFSLAYLAGYCIEHWMDSPVRNYTALGAKIICIASIVFVSVDFYMNLKGKGYRASEAAGTVQSFTYRTPDSRLEQLNADRAKLADLTTCKIGGLSWIDPKTNRCYLNKSGKTMQKELNASIRRIQQADSTARSAFIVDQTRANNDRDKREIEVVATLRNAVYGVYLFVALFCIVQAYIVESMQISQYEQEQGTIHGQQVKAKEGKIGFATGQRRGTINDLEKQIGELMKLIDEAAKEVKNGPENRAEIGYPLPAKNGESTGGFLPTTHTVEKRVIDPGNTHPQFTRKMQPDEYRGIDEKKYKRFVLHAKEVLTEKGRYNKTEIARRAGVTRKTINTYFKVAIERNDLQA